MLTSGYQFPGSWGLEPGSEKFYPIRNWYPKMYLTAQWVGSPNVILGDSFNGKLAQKECWLWQKFHLKPSRAISLPVRLSHLSYYLDLALEIAHEICYLPQASADPLEFLSPALSDLVHPCEYGTMAVLRTTPQTQRHAHTLSRETSLCLMQTQCEYWGMEFSSVLFCFSINVQGRSWCSVPKGHSEKDLKIQAKDPALQRNHTVEFQSHEPQECDGYF